MKKRIDNKDMEKTAKSLTKKQIILISVIAAVVVIGIVLAIVLIPRTTLKKLDDGTYDRGAVINMYLADEAFDFDPQKPITDDSQLKVMRLLFEGLTTLKDNGKWEYAIMDSYTVNENDRDGYSVTIELKQTKWTDGRTVQASDFVTSWKRLVDPNFKGEAASLLYDIKNAQKINLGDVSVDDLGVSAVDTYTLKVTFEDKHIDLDRFFTNLSSIALVPLREDVISRHGDNWAKTANAITTNGPFTIRGMEKGGEIRLERSSYYYRDTEANEHLDKYVIPYRLITDYSKDLADATTRLDSKEIFYVGNLPLEQRKEYADDAEVADLMMTHTYYFNINNPLFKDANVRRALSLAIDRNKIVEILTFAKPAEGVVPEGVFDTSYKNSFREEGGKLIEASANMEEAKKLLSGAKKGSFSIVIRDTEADMAVAKYVKGVWEELGYTVTIKVSKNSTDKYTDSATNMEFTYITEEYTEIYASGEFDVIAVDMNAVSPDAFGVLSQFSAEFSGNGVNMLDAENDYPVYGHITGYNSAKYVELINKAFSAENEKDRAKALHEAEQLLVEDMPVCPLVTLQSAYVKSKLLSGFDTDYYGVTDFKDVKMKNYMDYKPAEEADEADPSAE